MSLVITQDDSFELYAGETLLEGLERTGHDVEYQCRSGYCGSCRTRLIAGQVAYINEPLAYVGKGEILPCCCRPSQNETIQVDVAKTVVEVQTELDGVLAVQRSLDLDK